MRQVSGITMMSASEEVIINSKWPIRLPTSSAEEWLGNMQHHGVWEGQRLDKLYELIKPGSVVLYLGGYKGDMPALLASWGASMIIVEGTEGFWDLIKDTWDMNCLPPPVGCFSGLVSNETTVTLSRDGLSTWPERTKKYVEGAVGFSHLSESRGFFPEITVDHLLKTLGAVPDIITMDIEGSELSVLQGAKETLLKYHPRLVISVHPEFMFHNHGFYERDLHDFLFTMGYGEGQHLHYHHEHQYLFEVKNG